MALALAGFLAAACGETMPDEPGSARRAIVGGAATTGDPEVFFLDIRDTRGPPSGCSATLIGRRTLLTAAHCVSSLLGGTLTIRATNLPASADATADDWIPVVDTRRHPRWTYLFPYVNDVAVALIDRAPGVSAKPINTADLAGFDGRPIRAVGYGKTDPHSPAYGTKHTVDLEFRAIAAQQFGLGDDVGRGICQGDSGGPSFHLFADGVERVVGVHSSADPETCVRDGVDMRVDAFAELIADWLRELEGGDCGPDDVCIPACDPEDPDCAPPPPVCDADGHCPAEPCDPPDPDCVPEPDAGADDAAPVEDADDGMPSGDDTAPDRAAPDDAPPDSPRPPPPDDTGGDGCACAAAGSRSSAATAFLAPAVLALLAARRRSRRSSSEPDW